MRNAKLGPMTMAMGMAFAPATMAAIDLQITEAYTGLSGEDGTPDWIEVTNFGDMDADTGNYWYDDNGPNIADGGNLDSFVLGQGESAVFLLDTAPADDVTYTTAIEEFTAIWGSITNLGHTNGGGNLGQGSDNANLMLGDGTVFDSLEYASGGNLETFENLNDTVQLSVDGVNGAYESAPFFNDNLSLPNDTATLIGSPGVVPEPASILLLCSGAVAVLARRRQL